MGVILTSPLASAYLADTCCFSRLKDNEDLLQEALKKDLNKSKLESVLLEISWMQNDIIHICNNLEKWAKDEPMPDTPLMYKLNMPRFRKEPMGVVLVIGYGIFFHSRSAWLSFRY